jgi:hypothetical protein
MALETELATYFRKLPELYEQHGKFALIRGEEMVGVFGAYEDALSAGYQQFGLEPFLVQRVEAMEQVQFVSRLLDPCRT